MAGGSERPLGVTLTEAKLQKIADKAAENAVRRVLRDMGVDEADAGALEMRKDFAFLRDWRQLCDMSRRRSVAVIITGLLTGVFALLVMGIFQFFRTGP